MDKEKFISDMEKVTQEIVGTDKCSPAKKTEYNERIHKALSSLANTLYGKK